MAISVSTDERFEWTPGTLQILVPNMMDSSNMVFWTPGRRYCEETARDFLKNENTSNAGYISFVMDLMLSGF